MAKSPYENLPEPLKSHLPALFDSYGSLCEKTPSSWFIWSDNQEVEAYNKKVCHSSMRGQDCNPDNLITAVPNNTPVALEYLRMLVRGPFRSLADLIKLDRVDKNYYLHCLSLDRWPAKVLMNFCIASRVPIEFEYLLSPWAERCEAGFEPTLAWLLTVSHGTRAQKCQYAARNFLSHRPNHLWFDPAADWQNLLNGTPDMSSRPYKTHPLLSTPTNCIWGVSKDYLKLMNMTDLKIAEFYNKPIDVFEAPPKPEPLTIAKIKPYLGAIFNPMQFHEPQPFPGQINEPDAPVNFANIPVGFDDDFDPLDDEPD